MLTFALIFLPLAGLFLILMRREVTLMQKMAIGGRMPVGCAVVEGLVLILAALVLAILQWQGMLD